MSPVKNLIKSHTSNGTGKPRVVVGMSGGVDSSVAAALLKKKGYEVIGITFKTWPKDECGSSFGRACCNLEAVTRSRLVCEDLGIPYYVFDLSREFKRDVIDYFCSQYLKGLTPNPCVICNEKIKFAHLLRKAKAFGAMSVATGHYARVTKSAPGGRIILKEGKDRKKDQSYFLFSLSQDQLKSAIFPLGEVTKEHTRKIAKSLKLKTYDTVSSQDICFIQDLEYAEYIKRKAGVEIGGGDIIDKAGKVVGKHKGFPYYTIGQRRGLGVAHSEPLYVTAIDVSENIIVIGTKKDVMRQSLSAEGLNWISIKGIDKPARMHAKIRYGAKKAKALVTKTGATSVRVDFDEPQEAPTPGQAVVFYDRDIVVGGGWIK
ncbi:MAG: tRNA 2-thiouridine(34) synthase MnmA [Candidatus Omnitrophica bacterium]|nr:tRNA 2-thiouridine(34) synthase MnmA [Candidatus Omnitrophota bacterium]